MTTVHKIDRFTACELPCAECEAEQADERRQEGFMTPQEANARTLGLLWRIGEGIVPDVD